VLIDEPDGPALPSGEVLDGEDYRLDTVLRVPLQTAGFRYHGDHGGDRAGLADSGDARASCADERRAAGTGLRRPAGRLGDIAVQELSGPLDARLDAVLAALDQRA
jgi:hypothetical protein